MSSSLFQSTPGCQKKKEKNIPNCQAFPKRNGRHPNLVPFSYGGKVVLHKTDSLKRRLEIHMWFSSDRSKFHRFFFLMRELISFFLEEKLCNLVSFSIYFASDIKRQISLKTCSLLNCVYMLQRNLISVS